MDKKIKKFVDAFVLVDAGIVVGLNTFNPFFDIENKQNINPWIAWGSKDFTYNIPPAEVPSIEIGSIKYYQQQVAGSTVGISGVIRAL